MTAWIRQTYDPPQLARIMRYVDQTRPDLCALIVCPADAAQFRHELVAGCETESVAKANTPTRAI
jgi:hypothetical protein